MHNCNMKDFPESFLHVVWCWDRNLIVIHCKNRLGWARSSHPYWDSEVSYPTMEDNRRLSWAPTFWSYYNTTQSIAHSMQRALQATSERCWVSGWNGPLQTILYQLLKLWWLLFRTVAMKALQLTSNQCFYRGKVGLPEFHHNGGSTSKVHAITDSNAWSLVWILQKRLCAHGPCGTAKHHV